MKFSLLTNMKMPTIVGIFIFISRENFMLSSDEHEKSFLTSGPRPSLKYLKVPYTSIREHLFTRDPFLPHTIHFLFARGRVFFVCFFSFLSRSKHPSYHMTIINLMTSCSQHRFISACKSAKSDQSLHWFLK